MRFPITVEDEDIPPPAPWTPTKAQYAEYLARELELAKANIRLLRSRYRRVSPEDTLHTERTFLHAAQELTQ